MAARRQAGHAAALRVDASCPDHDGRALEALSTGPGGTRSRDRDGQAHLGGLARVPSSSVDVVDVGLHWPIARATRASAPLWLLTVTMSALSNSRGAGQTTPPASSSESSGMPPAHAAPRWCAPPGPCRGPGRPTMGPPGTGGSSPTGGTMGAPAAVDRDDAKNGCRRPLRRPMDSHHRVRLRPGPAASRPSAWPRWWRSCGPVPARSATLA